MSCQTLAFPLFKVPLLVIQCVIRKMPLEELFCLSLCSSMSKTSVKVLNMKAAYIDFNISGEFKIRPIKSGLAGRSLALEFTSPNLLEEFIQKRASLNWKTFMEHFMDIFHCEKLNFLFLEGCEVYDIENFKSEFDVASVIIESKVPFAYSQKIFENLRPSTFLSIGLDQSNSEEFREKVLSQEVQTMRLECASYEDLLASKSKNIELPASEISTSNFNDFIKKWMSGELNPNLESLAIQVSKRDLSEEYQQEVLAGIEHESVPSEQILKVSKHVAESFMWGAVRETHGRFEIRNVDGTKAFIILNSFRNSMYFKLLVYQPYYTHDCR